MNCAHSIKEDYVKDGKVYYNVVWGDKTTSIEPEQNLNKCPTILSNYHKSKTIKDKCFLYKRVSTISQMNTKNGHNSLEVQGDIMRKYASNNNLTVYGCFTDGGVSAANMDNQTSLFELKKCLTKGNTLLFNDISRFSRNMSQGIKLLNNLYKRGVKCISVSENLEYNEINKEMFKMILFSGEYELKRISNSVKNSIIFRKINGGFIGKTPFGFTSVRDKRGIRYLKKNKKEQNILKVSRGIKKPNKMRSKLSKYMRTRDDSVFYKYLVK